jgi:hypothetical protein
MFEDDTNQTWILRDLMRNHVQNAVDIKQKFLHLYRFYLADRFIFLFNIFLIFRNIINY